MKKPRVATPGLPFTIDCAEQAEYSGQAARKQEFAHNRLPVLAETIRTAHAEIGRSAVEMAERALAAGAALIEAKAALPHGRWANWLQQFTGISPRTAQRYMQMAASGMKPATVADLGIRGATASLANKPAARPLSADFEAWRDDLNNLLDKADAECPGFRAGFIAWANTQRLAGHYADRLRRDATDLELTALNDLIEAEQHRTLHCCTQQVRVAMVAQ